MTLSYKEHTSCASACLGLALVGGVAWAVWYVMRDRADLAKLVEEELEACRQNVAGWLAEKENFPAQHACQAWEEWRDRGSKLAVAIPAKVGLSAQQKAELAELHRVVVKHIHAHEYSHAGATSNAVVRVDVGRTWAGKVESCTAAEFQRASRIARAGLWMGPGWFVIGGLVVGLTKAYLGPNDHIGPGVRIVAKVVGGVSHLDSFILLVKTAGCLGRRPTPRAARVLIGYWILATVVAVASAV